MKKIFIGILVFIMTFSIAMPFVSVSAASNTSLRYQTLANRTISQYVIRLENAGYESSEILTALKKLKTSYTQRKSLSNYKGIRKIQIDSILVSLNDTILKIENESEDTSDLYDSFNELPTRDTTPYIQPNIDAIFSITTGNTLGINDYGYSQNTKKVYFKMANGTLVETIGADGLTFFTIPGPFSTHDYGKDKNYVYNEGKVVSWADPDTFKFVGKFLVKDKNYAYFGNRKVPNAHTATIQELDGNYLKDKYNVYYIDNNTRTISIISEADASTFVVEDYNSGKARDVNGEYKNGVRTTTSNVEQYCMNQGGCGAVTLSQLNYKNIKNGFELKYPTSLNFIDIQEENIGSTTNLRFYVKTSSKNWDGGTGKYDIFVISIQPKDFVIQEFKNRGELYDSNTASDFLGEKDGKFYRISLSQDAPEDWQNYILSRDLIKSSFKFIIQPITCRIKELYVKEVPGYTGYKLYVVINAPFFDLNNTILKNAGTWDDLQMNYFQKQGDNSVIYESNQTINSRGINYILALKNSITLSQGDEGCTSMAN